MSKSKTKYLIGTFLATAFLFYGCASDSEKIENPAPAETNSVVGKRLKDDNGVEYTLIDNGDGTETAKYDDGKSVTFKRQEDGSLDYLAGTAGLIAGMAAGYYLFHGMSNTGTWDAATNRYAVSEQKDKNFAPIGSNAVTSNSSAKSSAPAPSSVSNDSKVNLSKNPTSSSSAKSGFGTAGARAGSAAS